MSDDFNFFDDDSLIPDWMRDSAPDEPPSQAPTGSNIPPWAKLGGSPPPAPGRAAAVPPWETFQGSAPRPPQASSTLPPWGESVEPPGAEPADDLAFDWGTSGETPSAPSGELPRGLTGTLPWLEDSRPPAHPSAEDAAWLSGFGGASNYRDPGVPSGEDDDLDWLTGGTSTDDDLAALIFDETPRAQEPPAAQEDDDLEALIFGSAPVESEPPAAQDEFEALFADEFPEEEPEEEDLAWMEDDLGDLRVLAASEPEEPAQEIPEWLQADIDEIEEPEPVEAPSEEEASRPAIRRIVPQTEEPPAASEAPHRAIRRITPQAEEPEEPEEIDENDMAAWLARMGSDEPEQPEDTEELTYEEWERLQAEKEREAQRTEEDRMLEEGPDWFSQITSTPDQPAAPTASAPPAVSGDAVPDWFLGLEQQKAEETPDWFKKLDLSADAMTALPTEPPPAEPEQPAAAEAPDWFTGTSLSGFEDTDWDAAFGVPSEPEPEEQAPTPPGSIRRITPPAPKPAEDVPEWADDSLWETPAEEAPMSQDDFERPEFEPSEEPAPAEEEELPLPTTGMLYGFESAQPQQPAAEEPEISFDEEFALSDLDLESGEVAPGEIPDWLSQAALEEPAPVEEPEIAFDEEFALSDLDLGTDEVAPGEVPDWLSQAAPEEPAEEEALPLPTTGMLYGFESALPPQPEEPEIAFDEAFALSDLDLGTDEIAPGEVPDWLTAEQDARAAPNEVPFPEIDLDDTMPTEHADLLGANAEDWMRDFEPGEGLRRPARIEEEPEDFVERFEPLEPEKYSPPPVAVPLDDDAPDWLRELAAETESEEPPPVRKPETRIEPPEEIEIPAFLAADTDMDWLSQLSAEDVQPEPEEKPEMPPRPDESIPELEPGVLHTSPLDSSAIDQLLGLYEGASAKEEPEELEWALDEAEALFEASDVEAAEPTEAAAPAEPAPFEIGGVADWEWMTPVEGEGNQVVPDLGALFDEAVQAELGEDVIAEEGKAEAEPEPLRPVPEAAPRFGRRRGKREPEPTPEEPTQPEWIAEMRPSDLPVVVKAGGAETSIKQKQVIELPERLRAFHEKAMNEVRGLYEEKTTPADAGPLAGIAGALSIADLVLEPGAKPVEGLVITSEQQDRLNRLQAMLETVAAEEEELEEEKSQIEGLEPIDLEGLEEGEQAALDITPRRARRRRRFKLDRVFIGLLMLAALIAPFATDVLHFASDPPALKADGVAVGNAVDTLSAGQYVLVALEYGPTAAGELDPLAEAVLRDVLSKGAIPLTISTDPAGAFHAQAVIAPLVEDTALLGVRGQGETALTAGEDYYLLRYLAGEAVGVRSLRTTSKDAQGNYEALDAFKTDLRGEETNLTISNIQQDIALIIVAGAESDAVRIWAEQLEDVSVPKVALVAAAIEPLTVPYVHKNAYLGYLAGVRDTYSYNAARNTADRTPYTMPDDVPVDIPDPEVSRWHSMALGAAAAAGLIALGMVLNLLRGITRRPRR